MEKEAFSQYSVIRCMCTFARSFDQLHVCTRLQCSTNMNSHTGPFLIAGVPFAALGYTVRCALDCHLPHPCARCSGDTSNTDCGAGSISRTTGQSAQMALIKFLKCAVEPEQI